MGSGIGCALIYQEQPQSAEALRSALTRLLGLTKDSRPYQILSAAFRRGGHEDLLPPLRAWVCRRPRSQWLLAGDGLLQGGLDDQNALEVARRYGQTFAAPVLVCSVCDSDFAQWAYYLPGLGLEAVRLTGHPEDWVRPEVLRQGLAFPEFLLPYFTDEGEELLRQLWDREVDVEEERLEDLLAILGAPSWFDPDRAGPPEGTEWICAQWEEPS